MTPRFSIIVPTTGRATLDRALRSVACQVLPGDQVLVSGTGENLTFRVRSVYGFEYIECPTGGHYGCEERTAAIAAATGTHLLFLDDDDAYLPGALQTIRALVTATPDRPILTKMITPSGIVIWREKVVRLANQGTPCLIVPNDPARLGTWSTRYVGDYDFLVSTLATYPKDAVVWNETILCACRSYADRVWTEIAV